MGTLQATNGTDRNDGTQSNPADMERGAIDIAALRADFVSVRDFFVRNAEWTAEEAAAIAKDIGDCVKEDDMGMLAFWCDWFVRYADMARSHASLMDAIDKSTRQWLLKQGQQAA